jgi:hypothetical protein
MRKYITNRQDPVNAQPVAKDVATHYIEEYKRQSSNVANPVDEAKNGNICSGQKNNIETFNDTVSQGIPGQVIEIHGNKQTGTVMAKFENVDGSLADEVVTSADTPPDVDREEYYDDFEHVFGEREESFATGILGTTGIQDEDNTTESSIDQEEDIPSSPSVVEEDNTISDPAPLVTVPNEEQNNNPETDGLSNDLNLASSSSVLGKRSLDDSEEQPNKRPKNNEDDDNGGSGPTTSG